MGVLNTSSLTLQENRFKDGFRAKRKQKKPTDVGISVQDLGNPFFVTDLRATPVAQKRNPTAPRAPIRRHVSLATIHYPGMSCAIETLKGCLAFLSMVDEWRRIIVGETIGRRLRESPRIHIS